jgi:hypothetical protein
VQRGWSLQVVTRCCGDDSRILFWLNIAFIIYNPAFDNRHLNVVVGVENYDVSAAPGFDFAAVGAARADCGVARKTCCNLVVIEISIGAQVSIIVVETANGSGERTVCELGAPVLDSCTVFAQLECTFAQSGSGGRVADAHDFVFWNAATGEVDHARVDMNPVGYEFDP